MLEVLSNAVAELVDIDPSTLPSAMVQVALPELQRQINRQEAYKCRLIQAYKASGVWSLDGSKSAVHAFARDTGMSIAAAKKVFIRVQKLEQMPLVFAEYLAGRLSTSRVDAFASACIPRVAALFTRDEQMLLDSTARLPFKDAQRVLDYWLQCADESGTDEKAQKQVEDRSFKMSQTFEGTWDISGNADAIGGQIIYNELNRLYQQLFEADWAENKDLPRTASQLRFDALKEMARRSAAMAPGSKMTRPLFTVVAGEQTMKRICELADGQVIAPSVLVDYLCETDIETIVYDGNSRVIDFKGQRSFKGALEKLIRVRDRHCQHPSQCDVPASQCQLDHNVAWSKGGQTNQDNGSCLCAKHNRIKGVGPPLWAA